VTPLPDRGGGLRQPVQRQFATGERGTACDFWHMLLALALLSTGEAWAMVLFWAFCVVTIVQNVSPWAYAELMAKALWLMLVWRVLSWWPDPDDSRHNVDEPRTEVENFRVVREGRVVGGARRTRHALIAQVELGGLGKFTFTLQPAPQYG